jgi:hypothetical protein
MGSSRACSSRARHGLVQGSSRARRHARPGHLRWHFNELCHFFPVSQRMMHCLHCEQPSNYAAFVAAAIRRCCAVRRAAAPHQSTPHCRLAHSSNNHSSACSTCIQQAVDTYTDRFTHAAMSQLGVLQPPPELWGCSGFTLVESITHRNNNLPG